ncbi:MAG: ATP-binding protein [Roseovarius sp.]|nr:ATP-binding protein [Roseovarius sp.]
MPEQGIASVLAALPLAAVLVAPDARIIGANSAAGGLLGPALEGRHFMTALRQPDVLDAVEATMADRQPRQTTYHNSEAGRAHTYAVSVGFIDIAAAQGVLVCFEDMSEKEQASQMRRDFVANVSHELRTPLTALIGFIETLQGPARRDDKAIDRFLGIMQSEAARMERLVRDLLSLSRVENEEQVRVKEPVDLGRIIGSVLHTLRPLAKERDCEITFDAPEGVVVPGNSDQLQQVFTNLIENAIKYGGQGNSITITLDGSAPETSLRVPAVIVRVVDRGPGIDPLHIPRLTERFYRVDTHRSREMGGTGLGLAIVKHIVNRHRGRLRIQSVEGQGSEFAVILPRWSAPE